MREPLSTYRLQISSSFTLDKATELIDYLADLGADWVYLSPILEAEPGSNHGYDVIDHSRVDPERGGPEELERLAEAAHSRGIGVLVDIVPNHVGVATPPLSVWWWDLLTHGRDSRYAEAFDVDWEFGHGKVRLPVLGDDSLDALELATAPDGTRELHYYDNRFPVAPGTADDGADAITVHSRQHYELMNWRRADSELNYRRFFAVTTLAGVKVEVPWVFQESHAEIGRWFADGLADGLRVDHPDGLADPEDYLEHLAELTGGAYVLVEKILEGREKLPASWKTAGTTGYDALGDIDRVLVDASGEPFLNVALGLGDGESAHDSWTSLIHDTKRAIADGILRSEVLRIQRDLDREDALEGSTWRGSPAIADAIAELLTCFPVYRSYLPSGVEKLEEAHRDALTARPDLAAELEAVTAALSHPSNAAAIRFQQTSGMVMAKGVEDTAFYRWNRLVSLNEVGGEPAEFAIEPTEFHARQWQRMASLPRTMTTLSTHDTKRGEDVRARIDVLSELPHTWLETLAKLRESAPIGDETFDSLLWQTAIGAWPIERERLHAYAEKASREAGASTTWNNPDEAFEEALHAAVDAAYDDPRTHELVESLAARIRPAGWSNSLAAKLLQLTMVGVPDVYQGTELWDNSLVDPDNRRPVDFDERRRLLEILDTGALPSVDETGAAKLLVTSRALRLRHEHPELFSGYAPVEAHGDAASHVIAFDRGGAITIATRLPWSLAQADGWGSTQITIERDSVDALTGRQIDAGPVSLSDLLADLPVALLAAVREDLSE
ncbi:maltooligosyl trehalose synthase [Agreia sp. Leaf244]|uniref:malto-oligosyltrehalose synthase n=1 Tax=Agreia sp. Leaf244 TaxID=1736305 RepID=UPI0006F43499|nr:malto-oligosyltrehalose synthase [Agreia sp. Leaf244]KQO08573.1 maltooligosyl trehalose synthase [Agreia sp. Leaf244]